MAARVLVIGLDSAERTLLERWMAEGKLPALADIAGDGVSYDLENCWHTLPTAVWPELTSGRYPWRGAVLFPPLQLRTGEAVPRPVTANEVGPRGFWTIASDAGRRVAALDLPWTVVPHELNGVFVAEWATHDRWFGTSCRPADLVEELEAAHGTYPVHLCDDDYGPSLMERMRLLDDLLWGVDRQTSMLLDLLRREDWDLFACAFGQYQCAGHNLWRFIHDSDRAIPTELREGISRVYARIDGSIAALRAAAGPDTSMVVFASHGMGPLVGGPQLLPEVLVRIGAGSGAGSAAAIRSRLPVGARSALRTIVPPVLRRRLQKAAGSLPAPLASPATRAVALPSDANSYIRLNLKGREPFGCIEPGAEAEAEIARIRETLLALEDPMSGERIVQSVVVADEAFGPDRHPDLPDIMVAFRNDLGVIDACASAAVGVIKAPFRVVNRSGDHTAHARVWLADARRTTVEPHGGAQAVDIAATVLALLNVPIPADLDGRSLVERADV